MVRKRLETVLRELDLSFADCPFSVTLALELSAFHQEDRSEIGIVTVSQTSAIHGL